MYKDSVNADTGTINDNRITRGYYQMAWDNDMAESIEFAYLGESGFKLNGYNIEKVYSLRTLDNHAEQTTESDQPYLTGNIAPVEHFGMKNLNGGNRYMIHPEISFAVSEPWSVTTVLNWDGDTNANISIWGDSGYTGGLHIFNTGSYNYKLGISTSGNTKGLLGRNTVLTCVYLGNGSLDVFVNGFYETTLNSVPVITLNSFMSVYRPVYGRLYLSPSYSFSNPNSLTSLIRSTILTNSLPTYP